MKTDDDCACRGAVQNRSGNRSRDVYATAALAGAAVMIAGLKLEVPPTWATLSGAAACFALRVVSVWRHWNLPRVIGH